MYDELAKLATLDHAREQPLTRPRDPSMREMLVVRSLESSERCYLHPHDMKDPRSPNHSPEELQQELRDLLYAIQGLPAAEAEAKIREHQQLTVDRLRNQLSALRDCQKEPLVEAVAIKSELRASLNKLPNDMKKVVENSSIWEGPLAKIDDCIALYSSGDLMLSELEDEVKKEWKKLRKGATSDRKILLDKLYKKFDEVVAAQSKVRKPLELEQDFLEVKARLEQLAKKASGA